jgi:hypothetical protein
VISPTPYSRSLARAAALTSILLLLAGCTPEPTLSPTPTPAFASEEEAFAAAEETFEKYTDATNGTDLTNPSSFTPVFDWLAGNALSAARENYSQYYAEGITRSGSSTFDTFTPFEYSDEVVKAFVCLDIAEVKLSNADGTSAVPSDRPPRQSIEVSFVSAETPTKFAISSTTPTESIQCE